MDSYADRVRLEHAPTSPNESAVARGRVAAAREEGNIEPELVAAVANSGRNDRFHPTIAKAGEVLPEGFARSSAGFLLDTIVHEVKVNQDIVKRDT